MVFVPPLENDPVLTNVQENLSMGGGEIAAIVKSSAAPTGNEIMSIVHLMMSGQPHAAPVSTPAPASSSAGSLVGGLAAGVAAGVAVGAVAFSGSKAATKMGQPPVSPAELPAAKSGTPAAPVSTTPTTSTAVGTKEPVPPPGGGKVPEPPTSAKLPTADKYTIALKPDAAKGLPINPDNIDTSSGKVKVTPTPTSITAIPVKDGETAKKGFEMVDYGGKKYWVSAADKNTYAAWNKAYATTGGLKPDAASIEPVAVPAKPPAAPPTAAKLPPKTSTLALGNAPTTMVPESLNFFKSPFF